MDSMTQPISTMTAQGHDSVEALKGNVEAFMKSSQTWVSGCQAMAQTMANAAQAQVERNLSNWKAISSVKSIKEAMDLHTHLTRTTIENIIAETGKLAEAAMKLSEQTMLPFTGRLAAAAETLPTTHYATEKSRPM
jgi:hypothetical protein